MAQIFISHSQADRDIKTFFEGVFAITKVRAVFVEYESYEPPAGRYIQKQITDSTAMFLLLGPNVEKLAHTKVWIGSETGVAQQAQKAIWVFESFQQPCNVPVPFVTHYVPYVQTGQAFQYIRSIVNSYDDSAALEALIRGGALGAAGGASSAEDAKKKDAAVLGAIVGALFESWRTDPARSRPMGIPITCGYLNCRTTYRLHGMPTSFHCPVCRQPLTADWATILKPATEP
ncbi:MAG: hypothetical protein HXY36_01685 [Chloroflexi bacterium]|nr:hypothetical protein [Chloroflexota bacterium]